MAHGHTARPALAGPASADAARVHAAALPSGEPAAAHRRGDGGATTTGDGRQTTGDAAGYGPSDAARTVAIGTATVGAAARGARRLGNGRARRGARSS
jgi:hypothetical protein